MPKCAKCNDAGVINTDNNESFCDCPAGAAELFNKTDDNFAELDDDLEQNNPSEDGGEA